MIEFTINHILRMADPGTFQRGNSYFKQGQVLLAEYDASEDCIVARVTGSGRMIYEVALSMVDNSLFSECSCPVQEDCKHGVATALQWLAQRQKAPTGRATPDLKADSKAESSAAPAKSLQQWLRQLPANPATLSGNTLQHGRHHLLYRLVTTSSSTVISLQKAYLKQSGEWSQMKPYYPSYFSFEYQRPAFLQPLDVLIVALLQPMRTGGDYKLKGELGALALQKMLASERLILSSDGHKLKAAAPRSIEWQWQIRGDMQQLRAKLQGPEQWQLLDIEPTHYLDSQSHTIGAIDSPLTAAQIEHLRAIPGISEDEYDNAALQLRQAFNPEQLPLPREPQAISADTPIPHLTLVAAETKSGALLPGLSLHFDYAGARIEPDYNTPVTSAPQLLQQGDKQYLIRRDLEAETGYLEQLQSHEIYLCDGIGQWRDIWLVDADNSTVMLKIWRTLVEKSLPLLQQQGWVVHTDPGYNLSVKQTQFDISVKDSRNHWFDFALSLKVGDMQLQTMAVVAAWLKAGAPDELAVPIEGGEWISIDTRPLRSLHSLIVDLFDQNKLDKPVSLPAFQAAQLGSYPQLDDRRAPLTRKLMRQLQNFAGLKPIATPTGLQAELRNYQQQGLSWLVFLQQYGFGGILADDMGLGKTLQTLALIQHLKNGRQLKKPALVIAPTSLMGNWQREASQFTPGLRVTLIHGPQRKDSFNRIRASDLVITSYPLLLRDKLRYQKYTFSLLVLDEAQAIKNPKTKIAQQVRAIKCSTRLCLSGTPLENHLGELWALMDFALPGLLGGQRHFNRYYRGPIEESGDSQRQQQLGQRVAPFMLRRTKTEVMAELPAKTEMTQYVELEGQQRELYESIRISMEKRIRDLIAEKGLARSQIEFLDALLKLRQACIDPRLVKLDQAANIKEHAKMDWLAHNLPQMLEEGRNILVFSQFTQVLSLIEGMLKQQKIPFSKLTGQTRKRQAAIDKFQQGETRVFLISLKAGGSGLNLTAADVVIHVDPWWNPAVENQATDRAHRIGQDKPVFVYKLVAAATVEERILQMQEQKQALADALFSETGAAGMPADKEELLALLS